MDNSIKNQLATIFRIFLWVSIISMIAGKVLYLIYPVAGKLVVYGGAFTLISCPLVGLIAVSANGLKRGRKNLYISSLLVLLLIVFTVVGLLSGLL